MMKRLIAVLLCGLAMAAASREAFSQGGAVVVQRVAPPPRLGDQ